MADDGCEAGLVRHLDGIQRFGQRADLVELDQDRVGGLLLDAACEVVDVRHEEIVADDLAAVANLGRQQGPAFPVALITAILDGVDRVFVDQGCQVAHLLLA